MKNLTILLIPFLLISGCTYLSEPESADYNAATVLKETTVLIRDKYPFLSFKQISVDSIVSSYSGRIDSYNGDRIFDLLNEILGGLKDGHVWYYTPGGVSISTYTPPRFIKDNCSYDPEVVRSYFDNGLTISGGNNIEYGLLKNNIGYIYIAAMTTDNLSWVNNFTDILMGFQNTRGIILDVRNNGGGSDNIGKFIIQHFIDKPFEGPHWIDSKGNPLKTPDYIPNNKISFLKPVILLQNGNCFSATEDFISVMREFPQITTLGDTTGGGSGNPGDFRISYGITIHLSRTAELTYENKFIEWNGIEPDILIPQDKSALKAGKDIQLEKAAMLLENR